MPPLDSGVDPKNTAAYRAAKLAVIILSTLIILALIALIAGAVMKLGRHPTVAGGPTEVTLPPGAHIVSQDRRDGRLILNVRTADGEEIDIIDTETGRLVGRVKTAAPR